MQAVWRQSIFPYLHKQVKYYSHSLQVGDSVTVVKKITEEDVLKFSQVSGDTNPIHFNQGNAIVHGALLNGLVSGVIGTKLPGPGTLVISQNLNFPNKCYCNESIVINVKLVEFRKIIKVKFECKTEDENIVVLYGDAKLMLSK